MVVYAQPSLKIRDWDAATKVAGLVALLVGGVWSVLVYHDSAKEHARAALIDAQKPFSSKRLEVYQQVVNLTAALADNTQSKQVREGNRRQLALIDLKLRYAVHCAISAPLDHFVGSTH